MVRSELKSSLQFPNSFSCIFLCLVPTINCSIIRSLDSVVAKPGLRGLVTVTCQENVEKFFIVSFCNCNWYLAYLWVTLGATVSPMAPRFVWVCAVFGIFLR